jgi:NADH-quinone oxidoreductase subunit J
VHAALHLILAFFTCGGIWALLQAEFLAIAIILVYVGAVMVLFLFVVMMLDINIDRIRQGFWNYLPLGAILGILMVVEMSLVLGSKYLQVPASDVFLPAGISNTKSIGALMFSDYVFPFELASIVLLVGMIAAIVLTYRGPKKTKYTNPNQQVFVKAKDRVRLLQMPVEKD